MFIENLKCEKCNNVKFKILIRRGGGDSGTFFIFICTKCYWQTNYDFDNPFYEG